MPDPVGQGGALDRDAFARQDRRLTVERQPVEVFADHDIGDQARTWPALFDRQIGGGRLHDALAAAAAELGPNMADHLEPGRDLLQDLSDVLAELAEPGAAAARADRTRIMHDLLARQMIGQWPAYRLTPLAARLIGGTLYRRCRPHRFTFLEILEQQFELLDPGIELLRGASELHAPQLGKLGLILLDPQPGAGQLGPRHRQFRLPLGQQGAQLGDLLSGVSGIRHQPAVYTRVH